MVEKAYKGQAGINTQSSTISIRAISINIPILIIKPSENALQECQGHKTGKSDNYID